MARPSFPTSGAVLDKLKSDGTFDYFRRMCVSSVQEEPSFRAQKEHVEILSRRFLQDYKWSSSTTKNEVRTKMRAFVLDEIKKPGVRVETSLEKLVDKTLETKTKELLPKILSVMEVLQQQSTSSDTSSNSLPTNCDMVQLTSATSSLSSVPIATMTTTTTATSFELPMDLLELASSSSAMSLAVKRDSQKFAKAKLRAPGDGGSNRDTSRVKPAGSSKPNREKKEDFSQKQAGGEASKLLQTKEVRSVKDQKGACRIVAAGQEEDKAMEVKISSDDPGSHEAHEQWKEARSKEELATKGVDSLLRPEQSQHSVSLEPISDLPPMTVIRGSRPSTPGNQDDGKTERKRRLSSSSNECQRQEREEHVWDGDGEGAVAPPKSKRQKKLLHKSLPRIPLRKRRAIVFSSSSDAEASEHEQLKERENGSDKAQSTSKGSQTSHLKKRKLDTQDPAPSELLENTMDERSTTEADASLQDKNSDLVRKTEATSLSLVVTRYNRTVKPNRRYTPSDNHSDPEPEVDVLPTEAEVEKIKGRVKEVIGKKSAAKKWRRRRRK